MDGSSSDSDEPQNVMDIFVHGRNFDEAVQQEEASGKGKPKGANSMKALKLRLKNNNWQPLPIEFSDKGKAIGRERSSFPSYCGYLARTKIPITLSGWDHVLQKTQRMLWRQIRSVYLIPNTEEFKDMSLDIVRVRWKDYKHTLSKKFLQTGRDPLTVYRWITREDWAEFVKSRSDPKFKELSEKNKKKREANIYPHLLSRGGYTLLEQNLKKQRLEELEEASKSDPSVVVEVPAHIERQELWLKARQRKEGQYVNESTAEVAQRITDLEEQRSQGSFVMSGRMDILATALGKPDHRGQVRAQPSGVGIKKFFGSSSSRQSYSSQVDISELEARLRVKIREELRAEMMEEMETMMTRMMKKVVAQAPTEEIPTPSMANPISTKGSNTPVRVVPLGDPAPDDECDGVIRPTLCLDDLRPRVVTHAMIFLSSKSHHHRPIPDYCCRVTVTRVVEGEEQTALPMPETGELEVLGDVIGGFILS